MIPKQIMREKLVTPGKQFRHYKGSIYTTAFEATHSESGESLVVYKKTTFLERLWLRAGGILFNNLTEQVWARPTDMFFDKVKVDDLEVDRFLKVND